MKDLTPSREYIFPLAGFLAAAATVFARLREPMVANSGAAAIHLMNDRRSLWPTVMLCSSDIAYLPMFQKLGVVSGSRLFHGDEGNLFPGRRLHVEAVLQEGLSGKIPLEKCAVKGNDLI